MNVNRITTSTKRDTKGVKVVAKGNGRSRTVRWDKDKTDAANHGAVAGLLGDALGWGKNAAVTYTRKPDGSYIFVRNPGSTWAKQVLAAAGNSDGS